MAENELTFDEVHFPSSGEPSPQDRSTTPRDWQRLSQSPMLPAGPTPTTTVTPVLTPCVKKPAWNYAKTLQEAFPDAEFQDIDIEAEQMTNLSEWILSLGCESPDGDHRLAVLFRDRLGYERDEKHADEYVMSGALPNDDGGKENVPPGEGNGKEEPLAKSEPEHSEADSDDNDNDYDSDEHDEMPYGTGI